MITPPAAVTAVTGAASGTVEIGGGGTGLVLLVVLVTVVAAAVLSIARPWELRGGRLADKLRIGGAVSDYDFWLALRGVPSRRRRELRSELRANLWEAAQRVGAREALTAVGPLRRLAVDSVPDRRGPRWGYGVVAAVVVLELVLLVQVVVSTVVVDTALAAGAARVDVGVTLVPGMSVRYEEVGDGFSSAVAFGPAGLVVALVAFVLVAQPWRLLHRRAAVAV